MRGQWMWNTWSGPGWPASVEDEQRFVDALSRHPAEDWDRDDAIFVITALRCGATLDQMHTIAPSLAPGRLRGAYDAVEALRRESIDALQRILDQPDEETFLVYGLTAARLVPVPVGRLGRMLSVAGEEGLAEEVARTIRLIAETTTDAHAIEHRLERPGLRDDARIMLGEQLYEPQGTGIWADPFYLPRRVCDLSPGRLRDLLGDDEDVVE